MMTSTTLAPSFISVALGFSPGALSKTHNDPDSNLLAIDHFLSLLLPHIHNERPRG